MTDKIMLCNSAGLYKGCDDCNHSSPHKEIDTCDIFCVVARRITLCSETPRQKKYLEVVE